MLIKFLDQFVTAGGVINPGEIKEHDDADARRLIDAGLAMPVNQNVDPLVETAAINAARSKVTVRRITRPAE